MSENLENELENELMVLPPPPPDPPEPLLPKIIVLGGKDIDGSWGSGKTFTREFYFELINVPVPVFMLSSFIPAYNSLHPYYPFAVAKDSRVSNQKETQTGRVITLSTNYEVIKPARPLNEIMAENPEWTIDDVLNMNLPLLLPAQDVSYEPIAVEETLDDLYVKKTAKEIWDEEHVQDVPRDEIDLWKQIPFRTTAGTKLTGTRTRNILKMSFWYFVDPVLFEEWFANWFEEVSENVDEETDAEAVIETDIEAKIEIAYTGVVNDAPVTIAGRFCPTGTVKIESIEFSDMTWERQEVEHMSLKKISVVLLIDNQTWNKRYENVSNLFIAYPYVWDDADSGKEKNKMRINPETNQPYYYFLEPEDEDISTLEDILSLLDDKNDEKDDISAPSTLSPDDMNEEEEYKPSLQRIFCTMYDPEPKNEGDVDDPIYVQNPKKAIQFFGTREDCFRLNPDSEPTEVSEPMYLDKNGFILYPDPNTGKVDTTLSPKVTGYVFTPKNFAPLHFPPT